MMGASLNIALFYAGLSGILLVLLSFNVMFHWVRVTGEGLETDQAMRRAERVLASFVEVAPFAMLLLAMIEFRGAPEGVLHAMGGGFVAARLMHAMGSNQNRFAGILRFLGAQGTFLVLMTESLACVSLYLLPQG